MNDFVKFMEKLISKGYATESTALDENSACQYLHHHGVYNQNKPSKAHIVFDLIEEFQGSSIKKLLLPGLDLSSQIVGVLL